MNEPRMYEQTSDAALDIITQGLQIEQRELNRLVSEVMHERTVRYAARLVLEGYETQWGK